MRAIKSLGNPTFMKLVSTLLCFSRSRTLSLGPNLCRGGYAGYATVDNAHLHAAAKSVWGVTFKLGGTIFGALFVTAAADGGRITAELAIQNG